MPLRLAHRIFTDFSKALILASFVFSQVSPMRGAVDAPPSLKADFNYFSAWAPGSAFLLDSADLRRPDLKGKHPIYILPTNSFGFARAFSFDTNSEQGRIGAFAVTKMQLGYLDGELRFVQAYYSHPDAQSIEEFLKSASKAFKPPLEWHTFSDLGEQPNSARYSVDASASGNIFVLRIADLAAERALRDRLNQVSEFETLASSGWRTTPKRDFYELSYGASEVSVWFKSNVTLPQSAAELKRLGFPYLFLLHEPTAWTENRYLSPALSAGFYRSAIFEPAAREEVSNSVRAMILVPYSSVRASLTVLDSSTLVENTLYHMPDVASLDTHFRLDGQAPTKILKKLPPKPGIEEWIMAYIRKRYQDRGASVNILTLGPNVIKVRVKTLRKEVLGDKNYWEHLVYRLVIMTEADAITVYISLEAGYSSGGGAAEPPDRSFRSMEPEYEDTLNAYLEEVAGQIQESWKTLK